MRSGKVWLVGAGPGDVGLLTVKGMQVLQDADVVVYDSLVGDGILALVPEDKRTINVGKRASNHTMPQEKINKTLADEAKKGNKVVRLKGGDPFLFGRGGEELETLVEEGVDFEVVPGITSSIAVPAYNGIPVTHRDFVSSLHIITGHKRAGKEYDIDFEALVKTRGTLVFLMGVAALHDICTKLVEAGMDEDMPAAILQRGTTSGQKRIVATVSTLEEKVSEIGIKTPAIIVVGQVCKLSNQFEWFDKLPLAGKKVLVTRPRDLISRMAASLRVKGAEVLELPAISTVAIKDNHRLYKSLDEIDSYDWIVFTSPTGVKIFFQEALEYGLDVRSMGNIKIAAIGEGTKKALRKYGFIADLIPEIYDGKSLGKALAEACAPNAKILIPRAAIGTQELTSPLFSRGDLEINDIPTYDTEYVGERIIDEKSQFESGQIDCAVFTSASTVKAFAKATAGLDYSLVTAACIGKQTKAAADELGMKTYMAKKATIDSVVDLVEEILK